MDRTMQEIIANYNKAQSQKLMVRELVQLAFGLVGFLFGCLGFLGLIALLSMVLK